MPQERAGRRAVRLGGSSGRGAALAADHPLPQLPQQVSQGQGEANWRGWWRVDLVVNAAVTQRAAAWLCVVSVSFSAGRLLIAHSRSTLHICRPPPPLQDAARLRRRGCAARRLVHLAQGGGGGVPWLGAARHGDGSRGAGAPPGVPAGEAACLMLECGSLALASRLPTCHMPANRPTAVLTLSAGLLSFAALRRICSAKHWTLAWTATRPS